jgi:hypothetical protein
MEAGRDTLGHYHTSDVVDRPRDKQIVDSKSVFKIPPLGNGSVDKFKAPLGTKKFSQNQGWNYDEIFAPVEYFHSLHVLLCIVVANGFVLQQVDVIDAFCMVSLKIQ